VTYALHPADSLHCGHLNETGGLEPNVIGPGETSTEGTASSTLRARDPASKPDRILDRSLEDGFPNVIVCNFGSYRNWAQYMWTAPKDGVKLVSLAGHYRQFWIDIGEELKQVDEQLSRRLPDAQLDQLLLQVMSLKQRRDLIQQWGGSNVHGSVHSFQVWPYMTPDTATHVVSDFTSKVLGITNSDL